MHREVSNWTKAHSQEVVAVGTTPGLGLPVPTPQPLLYPDKNRRVRGGFLEEVVFWLGPQVWVGMA